MEAINEIKDSYVTTNYMTTEEHLQALCKQFTQYKVTYSHDLKTMPDFIFMCSYLRDINRHGAEKIAYSERLYINRKFEVETVLKMVRHYFFDTHADYYNRYYIYSILYPHIFIVSSAVCHTGMAYKNNPLAGQHDRIWRRILQGKTMQEVTTNFKI